MRDGALDHDQAEGRRQTTSNRTRKHYTALPLEKKTSGKEPVNTHPLPAANPSSRLFRSYTPIALTSLQPRHLPHHQIQPQSQSLEISQSHTKPASRVLYHNRNHVHNPTSDNRLAFRQLAHHQHRPPRPRILVQLRHYHPPPGIRPRLSLGNPRSRPASSSITQRWG